MADNIQVKDGNNAVFTLRSRDISTAGDGKTQRSMVFATPYPIDYGTGGMYQHCAKSGPMWNGIAAGSPIYSFMWPSSLLALINRVRINAWSIDVGFAAGTAEFDLYVARNFTAADGSGNAANLASGTARLRTTMPHSQAFIMSAVGGPLTVGTRTLDVDPVDCRIGVAPTTPQTPFFQDAKTLFEKIQGGHPLFLAPNEGFVIHATVPATGTWQFKVTTEWDEVVLY